MTDKNFTKSAVNVKKNPFEGMTKADIAVAYLKLGWSVIPVHSPELPHPKNPEGKIPCIGWKIYQRERAHEKMVRAWFKGKYRKANIGVVTGKVSDLVVIDIDSPRALQVLRVNYEMPDTLLQITGRDGGGFQAFFDYPYGHDIRNSAGEVIKDVDIRGNGGYVIVAPSKHQTTKTEYRWDKINPIFDGLGDKLSLKDEMLALCQKKKRPERKKDVPVAEQKKPKLEIVSSEPITAPIKKRPWYVKMLEDGVKEGKRDVSTTRLVGYFKATGAVEKVALAILTSWNRARNRPPLPDDGIKKCVRSIYKDAVKIDYGWVTGSALLEKTIKPLKWIVEGILPEGVNLLGGKPKAGKSTLAQNLAVSVALGATALGSVPTEQGDVLFLSLEDSERRFQGRLKEMFMHDTSKPDLSRLHITYKAPTGLELLDFLREKLNTIDNPRLVVIDTLKKVRDRKTHRNKQLYDIDYEAIEVFTSIANDFNIAVLVIHHCKKGAFSPEEDPFEMLSGSTGLTAATDANHVLERIGGKKVGILHSIGNDLESSAFEIVFDPQLKSWTIGDTANVDILRLTEQQKKIMDAFYSEGVEGWQLSVRDIVDITRENENYVKPTLRRLAEKGLVETVSRGVYQIPVGLNYSFP